jgi:dUTP pyrophosphatase
MENNVKIDPKSLEELERMFSDVFTTNIKSGIQESENSIQKTIDDLLDQYKDFKVDVNFINNSTNQDPEYAHKGDSGFDLRANLPNNEKQVTIPSFERMLIPTGLHFEIPKGYDIEIKSRSGLAVKHGITVLTGTIDQTYTGEIKVLLFNSSKEDFIINQGDRIAQALVRPILTNETGNLNKVNSLGQSERMDKGFGSSGVK